MSDKPIIRHCFNCVWCKRDGKDAECEVKYEGVIEPRLEAILCFHYKQKGSEENG